MTFEGKVVRQIKIKIIIKPAKRVENYCIIKQSAQFNYDVIYEHAIIDTETSKEFTFFFLKLKRK